MVGPASGEILELAEAAAEIERLTAQVEVLKDVTVHLMASVSLLEKLHADLAPSKKHALFNTKLADYKASAERARAALSYHGGD